MSPLDDISLSQLSPPLQDSTGKDDNAGKPRNRSRFLCYFLHVFLIVLHVVLLAISTLNHAERRITLPFDNEVFTVALSGGLQAFYTVCWHAIYTALLVFVTQSLVLSAAFSTPKKLTQIHDVCGAWFGLGASLSTLWSQTKVKSSILSIGLVTVYFTCISLLHVASSTIMEFQPFSANVTRMAPVVAAWPDTSVDLGSLDWMAVATLVPFLQSLYGGTNGLARNILYDVPTQSFLNATVKTTTLNAHCGLLTNLSIDVIDASDWSVGVSMTNVDPFSVRVAYPPLLNEIWFAPSITPECSQSQSCSNMVLYLVSAAMDVDESVNDVTHVYLNGTYFLPGGAPQKFTTPLYLVACSLNAETRMTSIDISGILFGAAEQSTDMTWSSFSPSGDPNLTSAISFAMESANSLPPSPYCQPIMSYPPLWSKITGFNAYMKFLLGLELSSCNGTSVTHYTVPSLLSRSQVESVVSQLSAELIWLAGQLGSIGGGFDRHTEEGQTTENVLQWRLNINPFPVIVAFYASCILCVLAVCMLWDRNIEPGIVSAAGMLDIMWLGSRSRVLRDRMKDTQHPSVNGLRASSMFETTFWTCSPQVHVNRESRGLYAAVPLDVAAASSRSRSLGSLEFPSHESHSSNLHQRKRPHTPDDSRSRRWCYVLHIVLVSLHVALLVLLVLHPEHSAVIPFESDIATTGLSALLQAIYTLYSALLVTITQRLALFRLVGERQRLTTVHDVSGAWSGIGAAIYVFWQQRQVASSVREITAVLTYLASILVLHIGSSSVMQWQAFNGTLVGVLPSALALPSSTVNISQLGWAEIFPIARSISQDPAISMYGLSGSTIYDTPQVPIDVRYLEAFVDATTLEVQCGLVPNLTLSYQGSEGLYQIGFSLDGNNDGYFLELPIWKDVVYSITPENECDACPQTLFYMVTTGIDVDESVHDTVSVNLNWTYTPSGGNPQTSMTTTYVAACSVGERTVPTTLNFQEGQFALNMDEATLPTSTSWSVWSPGNDTNFSVGMVAALTKDITGRFPMFAQGNVPAYFTDMDAYLMSLLGLNLQSANAASATQSSADPSETLTPSQLENALAQTAAKFLWLAGQLGEAGGGFQRATGEDRVTSYVPQWRLNLNTIPVLFVSIASLTALIMVPFIIGPSRARSQTVSGTSVLGSLWLEANSEAIHSRLKSVEEPRPDTLRAAGMFDICLGDIECSGLMSEGSGMMNASDLSLE